MEIDDDSWLVWASGNDDDGEDDDHGEDKDYGDKNFYVDGEDDCDNIDAGDSDNNSDDDDDCDNDDCKADDEERLAEEEEELKANIFSASIGGFSTHQSIPIALILFLYLITLVNWVIIPKMIIKILFIRNFHVGPCG